MEQVYEALFITAITGFEGFLEDLFVGLLIDGQGLTTTTQGFHRRTSIRSHRVARELLGGTTTRYIDWLPLDRTVERARLYFRNGIPFTSVGGPDYEFIQRCLAIRNAIAHRSRFSRQKFETLVIRGTPLLANERTPSGYLRSLFRQNPPQTRYENLAAELLQLARRLGQ